MSLFVYPVPFSRYSELFVESRKFFLANVYLTPPLVVTLLELWPDFFGARNVDSLGHRAALFV